MTDAQRLIDDLRSRQAGRVVDAVNELERLMLALETVPLPPPPVDVLDVLGNGDHDNLIASFLRVLGLYPFSPPLDGADRTRRALEAVLKHGGSYAARQFSLHLLRASPYERPGNALRYLARRGVEQGREAEQAGWLLSYLLDDGDTRSETVAALASWKKDPVLCAVLDLAATRMTVEERSALDI